MDDMVLSAPEIAAAIPGGRAVITLNTWDARETQAKAEALIDGLRLASTGASVTLEWTTPFSPSFTETAAMLVRAAAALGAGILAFFLAWRLVRA